MNTNENVTVKTHKELHEGYDGRGNIMYMVITVKDETGQYLWTEYFKNKAEALNWLDYA